MRNHKYNFVKSVVTIALIVLLGVCVVETCANINVLWGKQQGIRYIKGDAIKADKFEKNNKGYFLYGAKGKLKIDLNNSYVKKLSYDYETGDLVDATIRVCYENSMGKEEVLEIEDKNPIVLSSSTVNINKQAKWIEIVIDSVKGGSGICVTDIKVENQIVLNKYRMFCTAILILGIIVGIKGRKKISKNIEYGFAIIALTLGMVFVISIPTNKVGWDEETHFKRAYEMSLLPGGEMVSTEIAAQFSADTLYNYPYYQPQSYEEKRDFNGVMNEYYKNGDHAVLEEGKLCGVYTVGLIPQACAIKLARGLGAPFHIIFLSGRVAELLLYVFIMFWAIRIIPIGKRLLTFISLTPTSMFLAVTYTYDTVVFCFISLAIAIIVKEWLREDRSIDNRKMILANIFLIIGCLPKAVYAPIALIEMIIPKERYKDKKSRYVVRIASIVVFLILLSSFIIPQFLDSSVMEDSRGGAVDSGLQMSLILGRPIAYAGVLLKNIFSSLPDYAFAESCFRLMGHLPTGGFKYLIPIVIVFLIMTDFSKDVEKKVNWKQRLYIFILLGISVAFIWTALYIAFNEPGISYIAGVQGRYYRPLLWLLYLICTNGIVQCNLSEVRFNQTVLAISLLIIGSGTYTVFMGFCI